MKSPKNMLAILIASAMGLTSAASIAAPDIDTATDATAGAAGQQAAAEPIAGGRERRRDRGESGTGGRERRSDRGESGTGDRQDARRQRVVADNLGDRNELVTGDAPRGDRWRRGAGAREPIAGPAENGLRGRRQTDDWRASRTHRDDRIDRRSISNRERRFAGRENRHGPEKAYIRSHGRNERFDRHDRTHASYVDRGRKKQRGFENRVDRRLSNQKSRIREGWKSGELSRGEFRQLRKDQKKITRMDRRFGSDGRYTKTERRRLNKALDRTSKRVRRAKNNDRVAYRAGPRERRR